MLRSTDSIAAAPWNAERLRALLATCFNGESIVVLANREPFQHDRAPGGAVVLRHSAGGLVTALEPLMRAYSGVWVAHGAGRDRKSTRLNSSHLGISYAVFC